MLEQFSRTELLFGEEAMEKLKNARVAVFGVGVFFTCGIFNIHGFRIFNCVFADI